MHGALAASEAKKGTDDMNNDSRELQQVQRAAGSARPRADLYLGIHKALRALMGDTLVALGRLDCDDELELAQTTQRVLQVLDFLRSHLKHENDFIHPALEARAAGASGHIADDHREHVQAIDTLAAATTGVLNAPAADRPHAARDLYHRLALFVAHNFEHMHYEETVHNAVLWAHYSDAELNAVHNALVASIPPDEMMFALRWIVPSLAPAERAGLLGEMRMQAPAPVFGAVMAMVRPHLSERDWVKLTDSLRLPAEVEALCA